MAPFTVSALQCYLHLHSPDHHKKARHYWWVNGADSTQLQMFLLFPAEYRRYRDLAAKALKLVESKREAKEKKVRTNSVHQAVILKHTVHSSSKTLAMLIIVILFCCVLNVILC